MKKASSSQKEFSLNDTIMAISAHRYCLGRMTYVVSSCIWWLKDNWHRIPPPQRQVILRDTVEALQDSRCGDKTIDEPEWKAFLQWGMAGLDEQGIQWVHDAVAHRKRPWPGYDDSDINSHGDEDGCTK